VTLCGEEECPLFLGRALRVHWGLPDPASVQGGEEEQLKASAKCATRYCAGFRSSLRTGNPPELRSCPGLSAVR